MRYHFGISLTKTIFVYLILLSTSFANNNIPLHFLPLDSIRIIPFSDSTAILSVSQSKLPLQGILRNESGFSKRLKSNCDFYSFDSLIILKYSVEGNIVKDSLFGYKVYLDTLFLILNKIPDGRYIRNTLDPHEFVIQSKTKYISCVMCLIDSNGKYANDILRVVKLFKFIQEKAYKASH